eukprot:XP_014767697.1 PREDICTED: piggyBac transposable element-derived protein 4-like [Octopus bimaculoides]
MSKTRYSKISQYLHLTDSANAPNKNNPNYDPLYKVHTVINLFVNNYKTVFFPGKNLSVDETMIGYKGRVHFRQYMPAQPTKRRIKVWEVCELETGYCINFDVYTGKKYNGNRPHGLGHDVVWSLTEPFHHQHRHLYFNRVFSSVTSVENLARVSTYMCSTVMGNRKGLPREMKIKLKNRGDILQMQKDLLITAYKDKRQILFLSSNEQPGVGADGKPLVNICYNKYMGGVDKSD